MKAQHKLISIVMAYYNRQEQLNFTLKTIALSEYAKDIEVVIVDDGSNSKQKAKDAITNRGLDIKLLEVEPEDKWWRNPCIPNNIAIKASSGQIIVMQNPENFHVGDIIKHVVVNVKDNQYLVYACYQSYKQTSEVIRKNFLSKTYKNCNEFSNDVLKYLEFNDLSYCSKRNTYGKWYNNISCKHPGTNRPYNFLSAITRKDMDELGGFDERFALGHFKDDKEFLYRLKLKDMVIQNVEPKIAFCVHQYHDTCWNPKIRLEKKKRKTTEKDYIHVNDKLYRILKNKPGHDWKVNNEHNNNRIKWNDRTTSL